MCFPDIHFGPDIVFFVRLGKKTNICIVLQARFEDKPCLSKAETKDAVSTLIPSEFYKNGVLCN
jgi:hypothetical protein